MNTVSANSPRFALIYFSLCFYFLFHMKTIFAHQSLSAIPMDTFGIAAGFNRV